MRTADATSKVNLTYRAPASGPSTFQIAVHADGVDQTATFTRTFVPDPLTVSPLSLRHDHVYGTSIAPAATSTRRPAVLLLGGSNGGVASLPLAQAFAARGVPALAVAYFDAPGLPKTLSDVPLACFRTAVTWLVHVWTTLGDAAQPPRITYQQIADYRAPDWEASTLPQQMHLDVVVRDLDVAQAAVLSLGATLLDGSDRPIGCRVFTDPAGHPFCLLTPEGPTRAAVARACAGRRAGCSP